MAEDVVIGIKVSGSDSLASLKKEFKDLQSQLEKTTVGTEDYQKTLQKLGAVKDDIGDLRDTISALNPEGKIAAFQNVAGKLAGGFQAATGAVALFGVKSEELEKTLLRVQAASALAEGIRSVSGLSDAFKVLAVVIKANPIFAIGSAIVAITVALIAYNREVEQTVGTVDDLNASLKAQNDLYKDQNDKLDINNKLLIEGLKQRGATSKQIDDEILRQNAEKLSKLKDQESKATADRIKQEESNKIEFGLLWDAGNKDQIKLNQDKLKILQDQEKTYIDQRKAFEDKANLEAAQIKTRQYEDDKAARKKAADEIESERKKNQVTYDPLDEIDIVKEIGKAKDEEEAKRLKFLSDYEAETIRINRSIAADEDAAAKKREQDAEREKKLNQEVQDAKLQLASASFEAIGTLSDIYFQSQLTAAKGNASEELKIRKKQFEVDKAFSIARALIDGYRSVTGALAQTAVLGPAAPILAAANALLSTATVAKIASTKFDSGASSAPSSLPSTSSAVAPSTSSPVIGAPLRQDQTNLDANGYNLSDRKVIVTERDITKTQNRVNKIKVQSSFG